MADLTAWAGYKRIAVTSEAETDQTDFQVDIRLTPDNFADEFALSEGDLADLRVSTDEGEVDDQTLIPFYLQPRVEGSRFAIVTSKVPNLAPGANTVRLWYGNDAASTASDYWAAHEELPGVSGALSGYALDEGSGTAAADGVGSVDMTLYNTPTWGDHSISFSAASQEFAILGYLLQTPPANGMLIVPFTLGAINEGRLFSVFNNNGPTYDGLDCYITNNGVGTPILRVVKYNNNVAKTLDGIAALTAGDEHVLIVKWGTGGFQMILDGANEAKDPDTTAWGAGSATPFTYNAYAGGGSNWGNFTLNAPGLVVFDRHLTYSEIAAVMRRRKWAAGAQSAMYDKFAPFAENPVIEPDDEIEGTLCQEPCVLNLTDVGQGYVMFYSGGVGSATATFRATSATRQGPWTKTGTTPVWGSLTDGIRGTRNRPEVIRVGSRLHCFCSDVSFGAGTHETVYYGADFYHAYSDDWGLTWTETPDPIVEYADGPSGNGGMGNPHVIDHPDTPGWKMMIADWSNGAGLWVPGAWEKATIDGPGKWTYVAGSAERLTAAQVGNGSWGSIDTFKVGSVWYGSHHGSTGLGANIPSSIYVVAGDHPLDMIPLYDRVPLLPISAFDRGLYAAVDQKADLKWLLESGSVTGYSDIDVNLDPFLANINGDSYEGGGAAAFVADSPLVMVGVPSLSVTRDGSPVASGATIALPPVTQGASAPVVSLVLANDGDGPLPLGTVTAPGLTITDNPSGQTVAPEATDTFAATVPTATPGEDVPYTITIPSGDPDTASYTITVTLTVEAAVASSLVPHYSRVWRSRSGTPAVDAKIKAHADDREIYAAVCPRLPAGVTVASATVEVVSPADSGLNVTIGPAVNAASVPFNPSNSAGVGTAAVFRMTGGTPGVSHKLEIAFLCTDTAVRVLSCTLDVEA